MATLPERLSPGDMALKAGNLHISDTLPRVRVPKYPYPDLSQLTEDLATAYRDLAGSLLKNIAVYVPDCERRRCSCVLTVSFVQDKLRELPSFRRRITIGSALLNFDQYLPIHFNGTPNPEETPHNGQDVLTLQVPLPGAEGPDVFLVADVAGYLFGFDSKKVQVVIGDKEYIEEVFTKLYGELHPGVKVTLRTDKDLRGSVSS